VSAPEAEGLADAAVLDAVHGEADRLVLAEYGPPGVVIDDDLAIVEFRGATGLIVEPAPGGARFDLLRLVRAELRRPLAETIDEARAGRKAARRTGLVITDPRPRTVELEVIPLRLTSTPRRFFVVLFRDAPAPPAGAEVEHERVVDGLRADGRKLRDYQDQLRQMAFDATLVEDRERRRIAADLHDQIGQSLALAQIKLASMRDTVAGASRAAVDEAVALVAQSVAQTRTLIFDLSPPVLYDLGLRAALVWLVEEIERRQGIRVELTDVGLDRSLDDASAAVVFRAVRELLTNVLKHAQAPCATVTVRRTDACFEIEVADQGVGFAPTERDVRSPGGFGLFSVREQIARLGGDVEVVSAPQQGTRVSMRVPLRTGAPAPGAATGAAR
jgi:signal transduction histidine kinase